jgi:hypothetical protein
MAGEPLAGQHVFAPSGPAGSETVELPELAATFDALDETLLLEAVPSEAVVDSLPGSETAEQSIHRLTAPLARVALVQRDLRLLTSASDLDASLIGAAQLERAVLLADAELARFGRASGLTASCEAAFRLLRGSDAIGDIEDLVGDAERLGLLSDAALPTSKGVVWRGGLGVDQVNREARPSTAQETPQLEEFMRRYRITNARVDLANDIAELTTRSSAEVVPAGEERVIVRFGAASPTRGVLHLVAFSSGRRVGEATLDLRRASQRELAVLEQPDELVVSLLERTGDPLAIANSALRSELHGDGRAALLWDDTARAWLATADDRRASLALRREAELVVGTDAAKMQRERADLLDPDSAGRRFGHVAPPPRWRRLVSRRTDG